MAFLFVRNQDMRILSIGTGSQSWWNGNRILCYISEVANNSSYSTDSSIQPVVSDSNCLIQYYYIEVIHAGIQCILAVSKFVISYFKWLVCNLSDTKLIFKKNVDWWFCDVILGFLDKRIAWNLKFYFLISTCFFNLGTSFYKTKSLYMHFFNNNLFNPLNPGLPDYKTLEPWAPQPQNIFMVMILFMPATFELFEIILPKLVCKLTQYQNSAGMSNFWSYYKSKMVRLSQTVQKLQAFQEIQDGGHPSKIWYPDEFWYYAEFAYQFG